MKANQKYSKIILADRTEVDADNRGSFLKIYALGGETYKISERRSNLWDYFRNARRGEPIVTIFETYNNVEYISDARPITDEILRQAVTNLGAKIADAQTEERNRSTSLSYAKDLAVGKVIDLKDLYRIAEKNYLFIKGQQVSLEEGN